MLRQAGFAFEGAWRASRACSFLSTVRHPTRHRSALSASLREIFLGAKRRKPPLFSDGYGLGAIQELRKMYTATVTVVK